MMQLSESARTGLAVRSLGFLWQELRDWWTTSGLWWAVSVTAHAVVLSTILLVMGSYVVSEPAASPMISIDTSIAPIEPPLLVTPNLEPSPQPDLTNDPLLTTSDDYANQDSIAATDVFDADAHAPSDSDINSGTAETSTPAGLSGLTDVGTLARLNQGAHSGTRTWQSPGGGTRGVGPPGFSHRKRGHGITMNRTPASDRAVANALQWLARHQASDGSWSLGNFSRQCTDGTCACRAGQSDTAATSLALLPFLATGQTHKSKGRYRQTIHRGLEWLISQQKSDGDLRSGNGTMYSHGLATIALCEAYGLSRDATVGAAAQRALNFIVDSQDPVGGGWRYQPKQTGDLSVVGWQLMGLKSGMMAGLSVPSDAFALAAKFVNSVGDGSGGFGYTDPGASLAMSAVGLLCSQYLGARQDDKIIRGGTQRLLANLPTSEARNTYYWYYATQVMHNLQDSQWDAWNRRMRRVLVESQETQGCAAGSWAPDGHPHAEQGGRLMVTALNTLSLEVYYRNLPLYKLAK